MATSLWSMQKSSAFDVPTTFIARANRMVMMVFLFITGLFNRNIADDEGTLAVAFLEVEGFGDGVERFESEREVAVVHISHNALRS